MSTAGSYIVGDVRNEPLVHIANTDVARHYSDFVASGDILPGEAVVFAGGATKAVHGLGDRGALRVATASDSANPQVFVATNPVRVPDPSNTVGPRERVNQVIEHGTFVHRWESGFAFWTPLLVPDTYVPGDLIGWDADGARPDGLPSAAGRTTGAWAKNSAADIKNLFVVVEWKKLNDSNEGVARLKSVK